MLCFMSAFSHDVGLRVMCFRLVAVDGLDLFRMKVKAGMACGMECGIVRDIFLSLANF
jgi:hypothetical protein